MYIFDMHVKEIFFLFTAIRAQTTFSINENKKKLESSRKEEVS